MPVEGAKVDVAARAVNVNVLMIGAEARVNDECSEGKHARAETSGVRLELLAAEKRIEDETSVWERLVRLRVGGLHRTGVGRAGGTHGRVREVVAGTIGRAVGVLRADVGLRGMAEIVVD